MSSSLQKILADNSLSRLTRFRAAIAYFQRIPSLNALRLQARVAIFSFVIMFGWLILGNWLYGKNLPEWFITLATSCFFSVYGFFGITIILTGRLFGGGMLENIDGQSSARGMSAILLGTLMSIFCWGFAAYALTKEFIAPLIYK